MSATATPAVEPEARGAIPVPTGAGASGDASRAAAGTVGLAALQTVGRALGLLFVLVVTRHVVPEQFGRYSIVAGLVVFAGFLADFGSTTVITRLVSRDPESSETLLAETLLASVVVGLVAYGVVVGYLAVGPYPSALVRLGLIGALAIPADAALTSMLAAMDGHGLIARRAVVSFVRVAIVAGGGAVAVVASGSITPAIAMIAVGPMAGCVLAAVFTRRFRVWSLSLHPHLGRSVALFRTALPYAVLGGIGAMVARLDLLVLSWFASSAEVARYDLPLRAIEAGTALGAVVGTPALYILSRRLGVGDHAGACRAYRHAVRVAFLIGIPLSAILIGLHRPLTRLAFGPHYVDAGPLLAILAASVWLTVLAWVQGSVVLASGAVRAALKLSPVVFVPAVAIDAVLIPTFGAAGAAVATVALAAISCLMFDRLNLATLGMHTPGPGWALAGSSIVSGAAMLALSALGRGWLGFAALPMLPLLLLATRVVTGDDIRRLGSLVARGNRA
jgi:O-antigen/teichoic acid export membrane protein